MTEPNPRHSGLRVEALAHTTKAERQRFVDEAIAQYVAYKALLAHQEALEAQRKAMAPDERVMQAFDAAAAKVTRK